MRESQGPVPILLALEAGGLARREVPPMGARHRMGEAWRTVGHMPLAGAIAEQGLESLGSGPHDSGDTTNPALTFSGAWTVGSPMWVLPVAVSEGRGPQEGRQYRAVKDPGARGLWATEEWSPEGSGRAWGSPGALTGLESPLWGAWAQAGGTETEPRGGDAGLYLGLSRMTPGPWAGPAPHCRLDVSARVPRSGPWKMGHPGVSPQDQGAMTTPILCPDP